MSEENNSQSNVSQEKPWGMEQNTFCLLMHLSVLTYWWIVPIIMWVTNKDKNEFVNSHGKAIANFLISMLIYWFVAFMFSWVLIGFFIMSLLAIFAFVMPIIAALKANKGEEYKYPATIQFIK
ncbi:MAG: DUF4870 domain-containing protein [Lacinutrix sp.]|uniref:DUF4870 domain-containing protein n=1 Tax=Lacinutrix sp. TaxID=1937692 RepID=UPI0030A691F2